MPASASPFSPAAARAWMQQRDAMTTDMARHLIDAGALADPIAARNCLLGLGYGRHVDILLDRVICEAQLAAVSDAMQEPRQEAAHV